MPVCSAVVGPGSFRPNLGRAEAPRFLRESMLPGSMPRQPESLPASADGSPGSWRNTPCRPRRQIPSEPLHPLTEKRRKARFFKRFPYLQID